MEQEDYMRRCWKIFLIALGACMVALMSYDEIVKPLSKKVCCEVHGMLHSRVSWFQQRVVDRANCLCSEVMGEIHDCDSWGDINSRVSRIEKRYGDNVDPWGTRLSVDVVVDNRAFEIMLCSAGKDRTFGTDDDVWVTNKVILGKVRKCGNE
jgi:hypothetical protein